MNPAKKLHQTKKSQQNKKRICILLTGGTIAMIRNSKGVFVPAETLEDLIKTEPELETLADLSFEPLYNIDSSDMTPHHWHTIAKTLVRLYDQYDGFVITHGTDTMAYTASALSFLLDNVGKPIILTGSQHPLSGGMRTDAKMNLFNAILFAQTDIAEIAICFGSWLLRGNRTTKVDAEKIDAFKSPNFEPLGYIGTSIYISPHCQKRRKTNLTYTNDFAPNVGIIKMFPGMTPNQFKKLLDPFAGVVIEGFGSGANIQQILIPVLKNYIHAGGIVALKSQCIIGTISLGLYEGSSKAQALGVLGCKDMTTEAAFCKLSRLMGQKKPHIFADMFRKNLRGEMTK